MHGCVTWLSNHHLHGSKFSYYLLCPHPSPVPSDLTRAVRRHPSVSRSRYMDNGWIFPDSTATLTLQPFSLSAVLFVLWHDTQGHFCSWYFCGLWFQVTIDVYLRTLGSWDIHTFGKLSSARDRLRYMCSLESPLYCIGSTFHIIGSYSL